MYHVNESNVNVKCHPGSNGDALCILNASTNKKSLIETLEADFPIDNESNTSNKSNKSNTSNKSKKSKTSKKSKSNKSNKSNKSKSKSG